MPAKPLTCRSTKPGIATPRLPPSRPIADDDAVLDLDVARLEPAVDETCLHAEPHCSSAFRTTPLTPSSRCRASAASMPASNETIATFASPPEAASASSTWSAIGAGRLRDDAMDAGPELVVRRDDVDHEVAVGLAEANHRDRRDHVEDELLSRARLEPRRARDHLRPDDDRDLVIGQPPELGLRHRDERDRERAGRTRDVEGTAHVRRPAARAEPDDGVQWADLHGGDLRSTGVAVVLCVLLRRRGARSTAGDEGDDEPGRDGERRLALDGIDEGEPAGGSGSDVDEPATAREPVGDGVDRLDDGGARALDGGGNGRILGGHQRHERGGVAQIEVGRGGVPRLGGQLVEHLPLVGRSSHAGQCMHDLVEWSRPVGQAARSPQLRRVPTNELRRMTATHC